MRMETTMSGSHRNTNVDDMVIVATDERTLNISIISK